MHVLPTADPVRRIFPFFLVSAAHLVLLVLLSAVVVHPPVTVVPPTVVGQLVSEMPVSEPPPQPARPKPLKPKPVLKPHPIPEPPPPAPLTERAVTAKPTEPRSPPVMDTRPESVAPVPVSASPSPEPEPSEPVLPPRSEATHLSNPAPLYPSVSRRLHEQGRVLFDIYILRDGSVGEIRLKRSSGFARLDEAALAAVRRWRYLPARRGDVPIPYWYVQPIDFVLQ